MLNRLREIAEIWERDGSQYPQGSAAQGWFGFRMRLKCSICMLLGIEADKHDWDLVPVWIGPMYVNYADPSASWTEIGVRLGWRKWGYASYRNGI